MSVGVQVYNNKLLLNYPLEKISNHGYVQFPIYENDCLGKSGGGINRVMNHNQRELQYKDNVHLHNDIRKNLAEQLLLDQFYEDFHIPLPKNEVTKVYREKEN